MSGEILGHISDLEGGPAGPAPASIAPNSPILGHVNDIDPNDIETQEEHFGSTGQQLLTGIEGTAQGFAGPIATGAERLLSKAGVPGISAEEQAARAEANPISHGFGEAIGFGTGALTGTGEAALLGKVGEAAVGAQKLGEGASLASKIAQTGIRGGAELAALQAGDEASKFINDPSHTLGAAALNVGLSGLIGIGGGAFLGALKPALATVGNKLGMSKLATDYMGEMKYLQDNPDMVHGAAQELSSRMDEVQNMRNVFSEAKKPLIQEAVPDYSVKAEGKINDQISEINAHLTDVIHNASQSVKTQSAVPYISEDWQKWYDTVTNPHAQFDDKFIATNELKRSLESYAKWGLTEEGSAKADLGRKLSNFIRPMLEDSNIWGEAGNIQRVTNEATSNVIKATNDLLPKLTSKELGERAVDPNKLQTFLSQAEKGKAGLKGNAIRNYLEYTQKQADAINQAFHDTVPGFESPIASTLNPTPILERSLNVPPSPGRKLAQMLYRKGSDYLGRAVGETAAGGIGGITGALVGHPMLGAWTAEKIIGPALSQLAKPFAETAINSSAMHTSVDYLGTALKGESILNNSVKSLFNSTKIIPEHLLPSEDKRAKLQKTLSMLDDPQAMLKVGGNIGHYLPAHGTAAATLAATAKNYFDTLKPKQPQLSPFDSVPPIDKNAQANYNRALDVAEQPLLVLEHAKHGTLLPQDVQTINALFPGMHSALVNKINDEIIAQKSEGKPIPYYQRQSLSMLVGAPMGASMTQPVMQSIIMANGGAQMASNQQQAQNKSQPKRASAVELKQVNKANSQYATNLQTREMKRRS